MTKAFIYIKQNMTALWISVAYVLLGGLVSCSIYPDDLLNGEWWFWGWLVSLPVNIISFSYRSTASTDYLPVIVIQFIMLIPTFLLVTRLLNRVKKR